MRTSRKELGQTQTEIEYDEIKDPPGKKFWPLIFWKRWM